MPSFRTMSRTRVNADARMQKREAFLGPLAPLPEMRSTAEMIEILSGAQ
jgi:hypothetical protein